MKPTDRRTKSHWEPFYNPHDTTEFSYGEWPIKADMELENKVLKSDLLPEFSNYVITRGHFNNCDFDGDFSRISITFRFCTFDRCDFKTSTLKNVKFSDCDFNLCSFSQCKIINCVIIRCTFLKIYASGSGTEIKESSIENPSEFIDAIFVNTENIPLEVNSLFQKRKLFETKATLARVILANLRNEGSDESYFNAVKASSLGDSKWKMERAKIGFSAALSEGPYKPRILEALKGAIGFIGGSIDYAFLYLAGNLNSWGSSISRTILVGACFILVFSMTYTFIFSTNTLASLVQSIEILLLFGYTNHVIDSVSDGQEVVMFINACCGILWYLVAAPTMVNKLTRVRG